MFFVYIISNPSMTLYTGVTNDLATRVNAHLAGRGSGFTARYHFDRLVYFEQFELITQAIGREKVIKNWPRAKKITLIKSINPGWHNLLG